MGLTVNDTIDLLGDGTSRSSMYVTCKGVNIKVNKIASGEYQYSTEFNWFHDKSSYTSGKKALQSQSLFKTLADGDLPPFTVMYNHLKTLYVSTTDDL